MTAPARPLRSTDTYRRRPVRRWCQVVLDCDTPPTGALVGVTLFDERVVVEGCAEHLDWLHGRRPEMTRHDRATVDDTGGASPPSSAPTTGPR